MTGDILEVLHVVGEDKAPQREEVTMVLVLDIDCSPGVLPPSHTFSTFILNYNIGPNNSKRNKIVFRISFITGKLIDTDITLIKLFQNLK